MGLGQYIRNRAEDFDDMLINQAEQRANDARMSAIDEIKAGMVRNPAQEAGAYAPGNLSDDQYMQLATGRRNFAAHTPIESINRAMADDPVARYGYAAAAVGGATAGGAAMTAGAQKLLALMGVLGEAQETEIARDNELTS